MDAKRFDAIARDLIAGSSRRRALGALLGGTFSAFGLATLDTSAARSGRCKRKCGPCEKCKKGDCKRKHGRKRCKRGRCEPKVNGTVCAGGTCCGGACVDTANDPRNCGSCGTRCQVNGVCNAGTCTCGNGTCTIPGATCCPAAFPAPCRCSGTPVSQFTVTTNCDDVNECPAGSTPCSGPSCQACCPAGSTCDRNTGTCLQ